LVQTWKPGWLEGQGITTLAYRLEAIPKGTRLVVRHEGFAGHPEACRSHGDGWLRLLGSNATSSRSGGRFFLCRLLPPRPTFAQDMTAEEAAVMTDHVAYWVNRLHEGTAIVSPIPRARGVWALSGWPMKRPSACSKQAIRRSGPSGASATKFSQCRARNFNRNHCVGAIATNKEQYQIGFKHQVMRSQPDARTGKTRAQLSDFAINKWQTLSSPLHWGKVFASGERVSRRLGLQHSDRIDEDTKAVRWLRPSAAFRLAGARA